MPRGSEISEKNKGKIKAYHDLQLSTREITAKKRHSDLIKRN